MSGFSYPTCAVGSIPIARSRIPSKKANRVGLALGWLFRGDLERAMGIEPTAQVG